MPLMKLVEHDSWGYSLVEEGDPSEGVLVEVSTSLAMKWRNAVSRMTGVQKDLAELVSSNYEFEELVEESWDED